MSLRPATIAVEALDAQAQARFWAQALEWQPAKENPPGGKASISPADACGTGLLFVPSTRPKASKNRLHLELAGGSDQVRRLLALGASRVDIGQGEVPWEVLADPEGNEFCVLAEADSEERFATICLDAADPRVQGRFWAAATGWPVVDEGDWGVCLRAVSGTGPALVMGPPVAPKTGRNRLRLALAPLPGEDISAEVSRLLAAGASPVDTGPDELPSQMLADPEGNEFCILKPQRLESSWP
jgi:predicted enzyme related to lactoylglutathione lyase